MDFFALCVRQRWEFGVINYVESADWMDDGRWIVSEWGVCHVVGGVPVSVRFLEPLKLKGC